MDQSKNKRSVLESSKNTTTGYSIEFGNMAYELQGNTLEERIQAARTASSIAKREHIQKIKEKISLINHINATSKNNSAVQNNMTINKTTINSQELKKKNKLITPSFKSDIIPTNNSSSLIFPLSNNLSTMTTNFQNSSKPIYKGGGLMQRRLEAIKFNNKSSNTAALKSDILELKKHPTDLYNIISHPTISIKSDESCPTNTLAPNHNEYKTRSTVQTNRNSYLKNCDYSTNKIDPTINCTDKSTTSVQNRFIKAREELKAKSNFICQNYNTKIETVKNTSICELGSISQDSNLLIYNSKNKTKRLNQTNKNAKKKVPAITSITKKLISNTSDINRVIDKNLVELQQKPSVNYNIFVTKASETLASSNLQNQDNLKNSKLKELDSFSFIIPKTTSVQQRLENKKKTIPLDVSMEWEDVEPKNIVSKVNDLRKSQHEYEPMEWMPDSIMYCDKINLCLVIDTNILLSDLNSIIIIIDKFIPEYGYPTIVLPWQVLQELDCLKKSSNALGYRSREASRWLSDILSQRHPRLKGQPMTQKTSQNPDDAILQCAIIVKERVNILYLLTDDRILSIKAEFNEILTKNSSWLHDILLVEEQNKSDIFQEIIDKYPFIDNDLVMKFESRLEHIIARVLKFAVGNKIDFSTFSTKTWWKIYSLKPPLNLMKCLLKLKEHWSIIAPQNIFKTPQKQIDWLVSFFKDLQENPTEISLSWNELYYFFKYCTEIINGLPYEYYHITDTILNSLMVARKNLKRKIECTNIDDESLSISMLDHLNVSSNNISSVDNILQNILEKVKTFCSYVYKMNGLDLSSSKTQSDFKIPEIILQDSKIEEFCHQLSNIIKVMMKIKKMNTEQILTSHIIIDEYLKAIIEFDNDFSNLNKETLVNYCLMKDKNLFLNTLVSFQNELSAIKNVVTIVRP